MKHIKKLLVLFLVINVFNSCTEDEVSYALENISAPTNVKAIFDVSQDDSGTVTITPTAEGASTFEIYFGDVDNETPTIASPGEMVSHVYAEGEFNLRVVAIGITGLKSELVRVVTISFTAPSNLDFSAVISSTNPFEVTVTPSATNATVYDIFFGDVENEEPTTIMDTESAVHVYAEVGDYDIRVVARGAGAATVERTKTVTISGASNAVSLPITFDNASVNYAFGTFNGASFEVVDNPDLSGANTVASKVGAITNSGQAFEGGAFNLGTPVDFSGNNKTITMKLWSEVSVPILLKFEGGVNGERQNEVVVTHGGTGWEDLSFDFAVDATTSYIDNNDPGGQPFVPTGEYSTLVMFIDGPGNTAGTFYWDEIRKAGGAPTNAVTLPITFDDATVNYAYGTFNGASFEIVNNPDLSGANTVASKVGAITNAGQPFEGGAFNLGTPVDFSGNNKTITMKLWSQVTVPILLKFEGGVNGARQNEVVVTHGGTGWEDLSFDFANNATTSFIDNNDPGGQPFVPTGQYNTLVMFIDGPGNTAGTFYWDNIQKSGGTASNAIALPITFDDASVDYAFGTFNGASYEVVNNPDLSGANTVASKVGAITNSGQQFEGGAFSLGTPVNFSGSNKTITLKFWSQTSVPILLKFEGGVNGARQNEVVVTHGGTGWEDLSFDFANNATTSYIDNNDPGGQPFVPTGSYATLVLFVDGPGNTAGTFYVDNITQQ